MASVHFGRLLGPVGFSRPVAIKRLHPQLASEENVRSMFIDEARLAARIRHPNVVQTLDVIENGNQLLLVMDYIHGESVGKLAKNTRKTKERIPLPIVLAIMSNVLHGLHAAHEAKTEEGEPLHIVHRDVSPQNILVGTDGIARVLDFGIARAAVRLESTREGMVKGKLAYMAPEQLLGTPVTRQADIFATGVVLWELLAGRRLFLRGDDAESVMIEKLLRGQLEKPSTHVPDLSSELDAIAMKALEREPERRFASAREMAVALEKAGALATPSQIGEWCERIAHDTLVQRSQKLTELERSSSKLRAVEPGSVGAESDSRLEHSMSLQTPSVQPSTHTRPPDMPTATGMDVTRLRVLTIGGAAMAALLFAVGGASIASIVKGSAPQAAQANVVAAPVTPVAPPPATCPAGMQTIPGGKYFMGSDDDLPMERPAHNVMLSPYCMDTFEVTTGQFRACSDSGGCKRAGLNNEWDGISDQEHKTYDPLCNARDPISRKDHPINCVDWEMAEIYCKAQGKRLPSEAEWEFAARGPDGRKYPWGDEAPSAQLLNACGKECLGWAKKNKVEVESMFDADDGWATTAPVGSFPRGASRYGVQDVVGNVWEWVSDYYAEYSKEEQVDPQGPEKGTQHVIRGGAWNGAYASWVRPTFRYKDEADKRSYGIGFRCAKSL
jgi:formylglycine-generating enzyme required for sulfatase activity